MPTTAATEGTRDAARAIAKVIEPVVGQVYFAPECHVRYAALGFSPSPGGSKDGVAFPDGPAYFTSRGSALGKAPGELVAAAFGVFNPEVVVPAVTYGWSLTDAETIADERLTGAVEQLRRLLGDCPDGIDRAIELLQRATAPLEPWGRALFAGTLSQPLPGEPLGDLFRLGDRLREFRGDSHIAAWVAAGLDATEIGLLTEPYWGMPSRTYVRTRAWSDAQLDAAEERLRSAGLMDDGGFTAAGRERREEIELATDAQMAPAVEALGDELKELVDLLTPWGHQIMKGAGYPPSPLAITPQG
ncbi:MAG: SCO6745 family protein [Acidimicrobiales bacterium]